MNSGSSTLQAFHLRVWTDPTRSTMSIQQTIYIEEHEIHMFSILLYYSSYYSIASLSTSINAQNISNTLKRLPAFWLKPVVMILNYEGNRWWVVGKGQEQTWWCRIEDWIGNLRLFFVSDEQKFISKTISVFGQLWFFQSLFLSRYFYPNYLDPPSIHQI